MLLNEHQSKKLMARAGIPVPPGRLVRPDEILSFTPEGGPPWFLKAQVLTGGRGKAGGIVRIERQTDFGPGLARLFESTIKGRPIPLIRVEPGLEFERELYLSFAVARNRQSLVLTVSSGGGVDVEAMAGGAVLIQDIPCSGPEEHQIRAAFFHLMDGADKDRLKGAWPGFSKLAHDLYRTVRDNGLLLLEINPLVLDFQGTWTALDGKVEIDDNFLAKRPELEEYFQPEHVSREELAARAAGLSFHELSGWVGMMVNGAGLAMAAMDLLNYSNLPPANFMDLGGAADEKRMRIALGLLFELDQVKVVFLNLFGGIVSCEDAARAMAKALEGAPPAKPLVARLDGNGAEAGRAVLEELGQPLIHVTAGMSDALRILERYRPPDHAPQTAREKPSRARIATMEFSPPKPSGPDRPLVPFDLDPEVQIVVQGATGRAARLHSALMLEYGARITAGVTPFKGGEKVNHFPVYDTLKQAVDKHPDIGASIIFVPGPFAADAILEALRREIPWIVCITEGVPQADMLAVRQVLKNSRSRLIGPNTPGIILPGLCKIGIMPARVFTPGPMAVFSRSGTLCYEIVSRLGSAGVGQSVCVGIGGDPFVGLGFVDLIEMVRHDPKTEAVMILGEIGGRAEEELAEHVRRTGYEKPILAFVAGQTAPPGKRLGHAGAILEEGGGGVEEKLAAMRQGGFVLCPDLESIPPIARTLLKKV